MTDYSLEPPPNVRFDIGWKEHVNGNWNTGKYWYPDRSEWDLAPTGGVRDVGLEKVPYTFSGALMYSAVNESWERVRKQHPNAIWNPRSYQWVERASVPETTTGRPWQAKMREELARVDEAYNAGLITADEREKQRKEIIDRYT